MRQPKQISLTRLLAPRRQSTTWRGTLAFSVASIMLAFAGMSEQIALGESRSDQRPNVLLIVTDDQRPDTIHALGNDIIRTPHLDDLARRGVSLTRAVCGNPICTPSRAEILSGCSSFRNGVLDFGTRIEPSLVLWPEAMARGGYHTWYVGKWHNDGRPTVRGYHKTRGLYAGGGGKWAVDQTDWKGSPITGYRGWIFQDDDGNLFPEHGVGLTPDISRRFADAAIELIEGRPDKPFFLHVNFTAPHDPLLMPPSFDGTYRAEDMPIPRNFLPRHPFDHGNFEGRDEQLLPWPRTPELIRELTAVYYAVISDMDEQIGRILETLRKSGQEQNTIVIFTSDHGVGIGSHGIRGKQNMYEHTIGVPMIIAGPGIPRGERRDAQVYLRDLYPTVCELSSVEIPDTVEATSFAGVLQGRQRTIHPHVFGYFRDKQRMIRTDRWKLIHYPHLDRYQLFDLRDDPDERHDLAGDPRHQPTRDELRATLAAWQKEVNDPALHPE
jgi:arylsulfatase A-like enzyme